MITIENKTGFKNNECFVIVNDNGHIVDINTFKNNRRKSYFYSRSLSSPNTESQFETIEEAENVLSKCKREGSIKKLKFENEDVSKEYNNEGANILGFDFINEKIWIESKDKSKYGYDYRNVIIVN